MIIHRILTFIICFWRFTEEHQIREISFRSRKGYGVRKAGKILEYTKRMTKVLCSGICLTNDGCDAYEYLEKECKIYIGVIEVGETSSPHTLFLNKKIELSSVTPSSTLAGEQVSTSSQTLSSSEDEKSTETHPTTTPTTITTTETPRTSTITTSTTETPPTTTTETPPTTTPTTITTATTETTTTLPITTTTEVTTTTQNTRVQNAVADNYEKYPHDSRYYKISQKIDKIWTRAASECQKTDPSATLFIIKNANDAEWLANKIYVEKDSGSGAAKYWMGLRYTSGKVQWQDGSDGSNICTLSGVSSGDCSKPDNSKSYSWAEVNTASKMKVVSEVSDATAEAYICQIVP